MNMELAAAKGNLAELKQRLAEANLAVEEERRHLREITGPLVKPDDLNAERITYVAARLVQEVCARNAIRSEMATLQEEFGL
jgi:hypothetical protein